MALTTKSDFQLHPRDVSSQVMHANMKALTKNEAFQPLAPLLAADLVESDTDYHVHVDLPGVEELDVSVKDNMLTIAAERQITHEVDTDVLHSYERAYGKVKRRVSLPENANIDHCSAKIKHGVLTVSFPKKRSPNKRKLTVMQE